MLEKIDKMLNDRETRENVIEELKNTESFIGNKLGAEVSAQLVAALEDEGQEVKDVENGPVLSKRDPWGRRRPRGNPAFRFMIGVEIRHDHPVFIGIWRVSD
jgi:hypothetical protein